MRLLHWNCQGVPRPLTVPSLKNIRRSVRPDIMFLIETKNVDSYVQRIGEDLGYTHSFIISLRGLSGGLAIFWDNHVDCEIVGSPSMYLTDMYVSAKDCNFSITYVYGHPTASLRRLQWQYLVNKAEAGYYDTSPRILPGDFNDIKGNEEKHGGPQRSEQSFRHFRQLFSSLGLQEIKTVGGRYTWSEPSKWKGKKLFRYNNRWRFQQGALQQVHNTWEEECAYLPPESFNEALKRCRTGLARWKTTQSLNSQKKIQTLQDLLHQEYENPHPNPNRIHKLKKDLTHEFRLEEEYWKVKSRIMWLKAGDKNTRYFHEKTKQRRAYNKIVSLQDAQGQVHYTEKEIHNIDISNGTHK